MHLPLGLMSGHTAAAHTFPPVLARADRVRIGLALKTRRLLKGEDQTTTAERADLGVGTLQAIETARYAVKPDNIQRLAAYFGTSLLGLLDEAAAHTGPTLEVGRLTREDLEVARAFHDATTPVRQAVVLALQDQVEQDPLDPARREQAKILAERLLRLHPSDFTLIMNLLTHIAPGRPTPRRKRRPDDDAA